MPENNNVQTQRNPNSPQGNSAFYLVTITSRKHELIRQRVRKEVGEHD